MPHAASAEKEVWAVPSLRRAVGKRRTLDGDKAALQASPMECTALSAAASWIRKSQAASSDRDACRSASLLVSAAFDRPVFES